jgi:hypothetical protein
MRATLCVSLSLCGTLLTACAWAQPDTVWTARIGQAGSVIVSPALYGATELADSSFAVVGVTDPASTSADVFVARIARTGYVLWSRSLGDPSLNETASAVVQTLDGNLVVVGYSGYGSNSSLLRLWALSLSGDSLWTRSYSGSGQTQANDARLLPDGNIIITGYRLGTDGLHSDLWLVKCTPSGDTLWTRLLGAGNTDLGIRILVYPSGKLIIGGCTKSYGAGDHDLWLLLTDSLGNEISSETAGTSGIERCCGMDATIDAIWVAGRSSDLAATDNDGYLAMADTAGAIQWAQSFTVGRVEEQFRGVAALSGGGAFCVGWAGYGATTPKPWIADVTTTGTFQSLWIGDNFEEGQLNGIMSVSGGGYLIYGTAVEGGHRTGYLIRMGPGSGIRGVVTDVETSQPLPGVWVGVSGSTQRSFTDVQGQFRLTLSPGTYDLILSGSCIASDTTTGVTVLEDSMSWVELTGARPRYLIHQTSVNLVVYNHVPAGGPFVIYNAGVGAMDFSLTAHPQSPTGNWLSVDPGQGLIPPGDSAVVSVVVSASSPDDGTYDYYGYLDVHARSCPDSTDQIPVLATVLDVPAREHVLPLETALQDPHPNPFNAVTRLSFSLERASRVRLAVYDVSGRAVRILVDGARDGGRHEILFDGSGLASGVYLLRMQSGAFGATTKLLLLK